MIPQLQTHLNSALLKTTHFEKCPKSSGKIYTPTPLQQIQAIDIPESSSRPCSGSVPEIKHGYGTPSKGLKVEELVEINKLDATGDESELKNAAYKVEVHSSDDEDEAKTTKIGKLCIPTYIFVVYYIT